MSTDYRRDMYLPSGAPDRSYRACKRIIAEDAEGLCARCCNIVKARLLFKSVCILCRRRGVK